MINRILKLTQFFRQHRYGLTLFIYLSAAALTGACCVLFMRVFEFVLSNRLDLKSVGWWALLTTPLIFLISVELIRRTAKCAAGTGIPQTIFAAKHMSSANEPLLWPLVAPKTIFIKVIALLLGLWVGASTGREGPTVHLATCVFIGVLVLFRKFLNFQLDLRSAVVAGGAAGLAAAFNTPLAGVTFAIEELTVDYFGATKDYVLMAIIFAALAAKAFTGEYAYFGKLLVPPPLSLSVVLVIGLAGGLMGAFFSKAILVGQKMFAEPKSKTARYLTPAALGLGLVIISFAAGTHILGPGNQVAQKMVEGRFEPWAFLFPFEKIAATLLTYCSGLAGGIFAPALSIGSAVGGDIGMWMGAPVAACALVGMAAFLSGTIQAPITSFVIIFEMTGHHQMLLPIMLGSLIAFMVVKILGVPHLYQTLSENYGYLLTQNVEPPRSQ